MKWNLAALIDKVLATAIAGTMGSNGSKPKAAKAENDFVLGHLLNESHGEPQEITLSAADRRRHVYVLGSTGCGKSNLLIRLIEDEFEHGRTCVVLDLRGDLIDRILLRIAAQAPAIDTHRLRLIDLREDYFPGFNPLAGLGEPHSRALHVLSVLRHGAESWGVQLDETLRNSLVALAADSRSLVDLEPLLNDGAFREQVLCASSDEEVQRFFERYGRLSPDRQAAWSLPVLNKVSPLLAVPRLRKMLSSREGLIWEDLLNAKGHLILIALAGHELFGAAGSIGGLTVSSIQSAVMARARIPEANRNPVTLVVDEFETMASDAFQMLISEGRRFGLSLVLSHQNLSQVDSQLRQVIRNNIHLQLFFQTGSLDASELAPEIVGSHTKEQAREALIGQSVGEAFHVRRGQPSVRVETIHSPDPKDAAGGLGALKAELLAQIRAHGNSQPSCPRKAKAVEVRHGKKPNPKRGTEL